MDWAEERARLLAPPPIDKDLAYWAARCWKDACEELLDPQSEKWCAEHLATWNDDVKRAIEWLASLGDTT